jgi:hypothetical protein
MSAEHIAALAAIDASIADMRANDCTGTVENLLSARDAIARHMKATQALLSTLYDNRSPADEFAEAEEALNAMGAP